VESLYASLERLKVDYVDILYFHSFDETTPIDESLAAIEDLVRQDLVRYFAVSNFDINQINEYLSYGSDFSIRSRMVAVQNKYDILNGEDPAYQGVLKASEHNRISFVAWSPLGKGLLTDRYTDLSRVGRGDRLFDENLIDTITLREKECLNGLSSLAKEWGMRLNELVISYMLTLPGMGPIIPSSSSLEQLRSNAFGGKLILSEEQRIRILNILNNTR
jgi:aryl-alcohol dehydrogenase-like predicted oxidoreductase